VSLVDRLGQLGELLIALSESPVPTHAFQTLADQADSPMPGDYLGICLKDADGAGYVVHSLTGPGMERVPTHLFPAGAGWLGRAMDAGRAVLIEDTAVAGGAPELEAALIGLGLRTVLIAPVRRGPAALGALMFGRAANVYEQDDLHIATLMAAGVAAALETSRAYQALSDERSMLAAVLTSTQDAVLMINDDGTVLLANPAVRPMLGLEPDVVVGRPLAEALPDSALRVLLEAGQLTTAELTLPDGRTAHVVVVPVSTPFGEAVGFAAILRDVTLFKTLEEMKNEFVHTVSHDLKNPIQTIAGTTELMLSMDPGDPRHRGWCERIQRTALYMGELVGDLLDLGTIESGVEGAGEESDVVALVTDAVMALSAEAEAQGIEIALQMPPAAVVLARPRRIQQALRNVIGNALKYTRSAGRVTVSVTTGTTALAAGVPARAVLITVSDTGIGIPAAALPFVFDKFYRVATGSASSRPGTGLGLAITKSIVEAHGGRVWVESREHHGTTLTIALPVAGG
jgi:two-component system, OmpR family, phosphate regulon sensor histidine kinase PhoR